MCLLTISVKHTLPKVDTIYTNATSVPQICIAHVIYELTNGESFCERQCLRAAHNNIARKDGPLVAVRWRKGVGATAVHSTDFDAEWHCKLDVPWRV